MSYAASETRLIWTNAMIVRLIKEYQKHPELWDPNHESYRIFTTKYEAWEEVAGVFGVEIVDVKKKLNSILASHRRERSKIRLGGRSNWTLYEHLNFVPMHLYNPPSSNASTPYKKTKKTEWTHETVVTDELDEDAVHEEVEEDDDEGVAAHEEHEPEYLEMVEAMPEEEVYIKREISTHKERPRRAKVLKPVKRSKAFQKEKERRAATEDTANLSSMDAKVLQALKNIRKADLLKKKDECDSFGEYIANSLRKHDERTRSMIKHAINNILFEQEMKRFSFSQVQVTLQDVENPLTLSDMQET